MKGDWIVRETLAASAALAALAILVSLIVGRSDVGLGLAAGLVIGSMNGVLVRRALVHCAPFVAASVARLVLLSGAAILLAYLFHASAVALVLGVACAQLVMVAVAVREGLRA